MYNSHFNTIIHYTRLSPTNISLTCFTVDALFEVFNECAELNPEPVDGPGAVPDSPCNLDFKTF